MKKQLLIKGVLALFMLVLSAGTWAQQGTTVSGTIIGAEDNSALPMATVQVKGTNLGTVSDINGKYNLQNVPAGSTLVFSYVGMVSQELPLGASAVIDVTLQPDIQQLEKVVVIGYGTARRSQVVGSVSQVTSGEITKQPVMDAVQGLQGKSAGVQIISSGEPGKASEVRIRGTNSITGNTNPIYVVDGVIVDNLLNINSSDIESIEVLKDAASQAIYGSRSANGVILVSTRSGKMGKMSVNANAYVGMRSMTSKVEMADAKTYAQFTNEARGYDGQPPMYNVDTLKYNTDWFDEITRKGIVQNYNVSVSGGSEKTTYYFSADYFKDEGILIGNAYERVVLRNSNTYKINKFLTLGHTINYTFAHNNIKPNVFGDAYRIGSTAPVKNPDGSFGYVEGLHVANPVAAIYYTNQYTDRSQLQGNAFLDLTIIKGLKIRSSINFNNPVTDGLSYVPVYRVSDDQKNERSLLNINNDRFLYYIFDNNVTYTNTFLDIHEINLTLGYSAEHDKKNFFNGSRKDVPNQENLWYLDQGDPNTAENHSYAELIQRASYYGRITYTLNNKYNLSGVLRRDGSSLFPVNQKWGTFYSVGATWILSREGFMESQRIFDELKLRGSWGVTGNDNIPYGTGVLTAVEDPGPYSFGGLSYGVVQALTIRNLKDASISWETTKGLDFGLEFGVLKSRLNGEIGWYSKLTNAYIPTIVPTAAGDLEGSVYSRAADVRNKGVEILLNWKDQINGEWRYNAGFNITFNHNNVEDVKGGLQLKDGGLGNGKTTTYTVKGQPIGSFWVYKTLGIYQSADDIAATPHLNSAKPGDLRFADVNGDNKIDDKDKVFVGSYQPKMFFGFNAGVSWKQIDFSVDCYGNFGNKIYNGKKGVRFGNDNIEAARAKDRWTPDNLNGTQPRASNLIPEPSDYFVESGDFFRINNLTLGYTLNSANWKLGIAKFRIYATAQNPVIFKKYSGFTPELPGSPLSSGIELGIYPVFSTYMIGINLSF
jgi:TonB-linked SusC/RagA family outer membrane protein